MGRKPSRKMTKRVETRSEARNAEKQTASTAQSSKATKSEKTPKTVQKKEKSTKIPESKQNDGKGVKEKVKSKAKEKVNSPKTAPSNGVNKEKSKDGLTAAKGNSQEELDYDETGLDQALNGDSDTDTDSSSESESSSSEEQTDSEGSLVFNEDSDEGTVNDSSVNTNNAATADEPGQGSPVKKTNKRKSGPDPDNSVSKKRKKEKTITLTQTALQDLMKSTIANYEKTKEEKEARKSKLQSYAKSNDKEIDGFEINQSKSETTIYSRLCPPINNDVSKESSLNIGEVIQSVDQMEVSESNQSDDSLNVQMNSSDENNAINFSELPTVPPQMVPPPPELNQHPKEKAQKLADDMVKQAELQKAELAKPPGENLMTPNVSSSENLDGSLDYLHNSGSAHVDTATRLRIRNDWYVELHKLLPRDFDLIDEEDSLCLTNRDGRTYHVPPLEREGNNVGTFKRWQIAFKVFMAVYIEEHPTRVKKPLELIQYMQMIEEMTTTWIWDNVYKYDKRHRRMMQQFPNRHWHVPYQVAKGELKVTHAANNNSNNPRFKKPGQNAKPKKDVCRNYNRGKCQYGASCRYDHKCSTCGKFGHNALQCRQKESKEVKEQNSEQSN